MYGRFMLFLTNKTKDGPYCFMENTIGPVFYLMDKTKPYFPVYTVFLWLP